MRISTKFRRATTVLATLWLLGMSTLSLFAFAARTAHADDGASSSVMGITIVASAKCRGLGTAATPDLCEGLNESAKSVDDKLIKPALQMALLTALLNLVTFVFDRLAYEAAIWVATGGEGETPLFNAKDAASAWGDFGLDIVGDAIGELNNEVLDAMNLDFDLCAPENPLFKLSLQLGLQQAYQPEQPACEFQDIMENWDSFITTTVEQAANPSQTILKAFADGFSPGQNELSATVGLNLAVHNRVLEAKNIHLQEQVNSGGFKPVTEIITGKVKTPASTLQMQFEEQMKDSQGEPTQARLNAAINNADLLGNMFMHVAGVFTNTLLSTLMNKVFTGLFDVQPDVDPLDQELAVAVTREDAEAQFSSLISTAIPTQVSDYNILTEFVTCPVGPVTTRSLNQCVLDASFVSAVARSGNGTPITVQDAIDEGLLHADWTLVSPDDTSTNQDPFCYSYAYCYGNLVKMRKARLIPVGWEIAADQNSTSSPATLQEIIDDFDDETSDFYRLVDPNWVLKYPETQCRALVNGQLTISTLSPGRNGECVDTPSCLSEDADGQCDGGFGYCVQEGNAWRFRGEECPAEYASCMSFENADNGDNVDYLLNTVEYSVCNADNAGCEWYRTNKYYDDGGTPDDMSDDAYEWLAGDDDFVTADRDDDVLRYDVAAAANVARTDYTYEATGGDTADLTDDISYSRYSFEDRVYFNNNVEECSSDAAGCSAVYHVNDELVLNVVQNPSFETDEDLDLQPDGWTTYTASGTLDESGLYDIYGNNAYTTGAGMIYQPNIRLAPGSFYTFSFYARQDASTGTDTVTGYVVLTDNDGEDLSLGGTSTSSGCAVTSYLGTNNAVVINAEEPEDADYERFDCAFTVPDEGNGAVAQIWLDSNGAYLDAVQLELGEDANDYAEGYNSASPDTSYLLTAPDYLGCSGAETDPSECDLYTQVCEAVDVGCNLYTPEDGDPAVPAIASELDECPSECVGYATFKQEATDREIDEFPLFFIADRATACTSQYVGCDAFTNLDALEEGGEGAESYTYLRACVKPEMAPGDASNNESATFFTWEGSDAAGYQLVTWILLESDSPDGDSLTFDESLNSESAIGLAPCVEWTVSSEDTLVCDEDSTTTVAIAANDECDEHDDIFDNPDCREFYDQSGNIHYRELPDTVAVSEDCHPYRFAGSSETDCLASGGFWTSVGECRYFGLPDESDECPATQAGCREYTGGAGRNATTVYDEDFEDGDLVEYDEDGGAVSSVSNESVATGGHSMRVSTETPGTGGSVSTLWIYLDSAADPDVTYDEDDETTCTDEGWTVDDDGDCEIDEDGDGTAECTVVDGENGCGTLDDLLVPGKTYVLSFWAKGSGDIKVFFSDQDGAGDDHDFVDPSDDTPTEPDALALEGGWHAYELGPVDTEDFDDFDDDATLHFYAAGGETFYVDNVRLKSVEEDITIIKDSWVVPAACDQTPDGADSDQYYLGCEAYVDQDGEDANLYQFSDLCSEEVVGCEVVYDTQNSSSESGEIRNARCMYVDATGADVVTTTSTSCLVDGDTVCTIAAGESFCLYDAEGNVPSPMPYEATTGGYFYMALGPEAVVVEGDMPMYLVDNGSTSCTAENAGCEEVGYPDYDIDKTNVDSFESVYLINAPDDYDDILCEDEALFCEEWTSTQDGNFYFKEPKDQTCEHRSSVDIDGTTYSGWFRTDTDEPCYEEYLVSGEDYAIWRNGDDAYTGWIGECSSSYDLCTEFRDQSDTSDGDYPAGNPYYFLDDDTLSEESITASQQCQGQVSQKAGCALFNDTTDSELAYATEPSYVASTRADELFGDAPGSKQDPVSCDDGGDDLTLSDGSTVNLCDLRCAYTLDSGIDLNVGNQIDSVYHAATYATNVQYAGGCLIDDDCPNLRGDDGIAYEGMCTDVTDIEGDGTVTETDTDEDAIFENDANRILKVYRDRECSAWLSCSSTRVAWDAGSATYKEICLEIGLCTQQSSTDSTVCAQYATSLADALTPTVYKGRDTTWDGTEYSGYSIPNQLSIDHFVEVNVNPDTTASICVEDADIDEPVPIISDEGGFVSGDSEEECTDLGYEPHTFVEDIRLVFDAGSCDMAEVGWEGECAVGLCEESGEACSTSDECGSGDLCVTGYCQQRSSTGCASTADADDDGVHDACADAIAYGFDGTSVIEVPTPYCDIVHQLCADALSTNAEGCNYQDYEGCTNTSAACVSAPAFSGICVNNDCVSGLDGEMLDPQNAETVECRGNPEVMSPFKTKAVSQWLEEPGVTDDLLPSTGEGDSVDDDAQGFIDALPYQYVSGYQGVSVCQPDENGETNDDCVCSYDKVTYGQGGLYRYLAPGAGASSMTGALCQGGTRNGAACNPDATSDDIDGDGTADSDESTVDQALISDLYCGTYGTCATVSRVDTYYGWDGYCLERDTSIHMYSSSDSADEPCLTWLPVDELASSTDLYGKFVDAGYPREDTYYCAEIQDAYDLKVLEEGEIIACAETYGVTGTCHDASWADFTSSFNLSDSCLESVWCPDGYFAVMTGCADLADTNGDETLDNTDLCYGTGLQDNDCPFFCVPTGSYKTADTDTGVTGATGDPCLPPVELDALGALSGFSVDSDDGAASVFDDGVATAYELDALLDSDRAYPSGYSGTSYAESAGYPGFDAYLVKASLSSEATFLDVFYYYNDCQTRGIVGDSIDDFVYPFPGVESLLATDTDQTGNSAAYRGLDFDAEIYAACTAVVQVADDVAVGGHYNYAWTDRTWESGLDFAIRDEDDRFLYEVDTPQTVFGRATDVNVFMESVVSDGNEDLYPMLTVMCDDGTVAGQDDVGSGAIASCTLTDSSGIDAQPYYEVEVASEVGYIVVAGTDDEEFCGDDAEGDATTDVDASTSTLAYIDSSTGSGNITECACTSDEQCNDGITCSGGLCSDGPRAGQYCDEPEQCYAFVCAEDAGEVSVADRSPTPIDVCATLDASGTGAVTTFLELEDEDDAINRLRQIFAKAMDVWFYRDGFYSSTMFYSNESVNDEGTDWDWPWNSAGSYVKLSESDDWNVFATGEETTIQYIFLDDEGTRFNGWGGWDYTAEADPSNVSLAADPVPPTVLSIGNCEGNECEEGEEGTFSVNDQNNGEVEGTGGQKHVTLSFFTYADSNQMPIRQINVDWGDADDAYLSGTDPLDWIPDPVGSTSSDNFYRNYRGFDADGETELCGTDSAWGYTSESCGTSYLTFTHDYVCSQNDYDTLTSLGRVCDLDPVTGELLNSPCVDTEGNLGIGTSEACVYQPRVHVKDNWGWCTGTCNSEETGSDGTDGCYGGGVVNECDVDNCPGPDCDAGSEDAYTVNPWVNFDGYVVVTPP